MTSKHIELVKTKEHKEQDGCVAKHEPNFESPTYPKCAYRVLGYEARKESVKGLVPPATKESLYELDFTQEEHRARLPKDGMEWVKQTGRQSKVDKELGTKRRMYQNSDPRANANKAWHFIGDNYKVWHKPFGHEYHHIMPEEALSESLDTKEAEYLMAAGYNMNAGKNIIILPTTRDVAYALMLPRHKGAHRSYNQECMSIINSNKRDIEEMNPEHGITPDTVGGLKDKLETWQENEFAVLVVKGRLAAAQGMSTQVNSMYKK